MQIKRFEAEDMTDALRMVKREFGDDAVILSAKESRPRGFFGAFRKTCVEITAATDYPLNDEEEGSDFSKQLSAQLDVETENDRVSLSTQPSVFVPMAVGPKSSDAPDDSPGRVKTTTAVAVDRCGTQDARVSNSADGSQRGDVDRWRPRCKREAMTTAPFYRDLSQRRVIALVGGHGTGKSTAVAKLARHCCLIEKLSVALISLDRFRIGGNRTLQTVSQIMNLPFSIVRDAEQLQTALNEQARADVVLIDTPGMGKGDAPMLDDIARLLDAAKPDEIQLVVNATVRQPVVDGWIETFRPMGVDHLFLTHMDEYGIDDSLWEILGTHRLPSAFYTDGVDLLDHLQETTLDALDHFCRPRQTKPERVTDFPAKTLSSTVDKINTPYDDDGDAIHFVANRNSELFHHPDCKSVKRINAENITAFSSIEQALEEGFKPCRACCSNEMIKNALPSVFAHRRARAI
jgi:flagellar biosynthesis GTPase FlhF